MANDLKSRTVLAIVRAIFVIALVWGISVHTLAFFRIFSNPPDTQTSIPSESEITSSEDAQESKQEEVDPPPLPPPPPQLQIPSKEELLERFTKIQSEMGAEHKSPSHFVIEAIETVQKLEFDYANLQTNLKQNQSDMKSQFESLQNVIDTTLSQQLIKKENIHMNNQPMQIKMSNLEQLFRTTSFAPYSDDDIDFMFQQAAREIQSMSQMQMRMTPENYPEWYSLLQGLQDLVSNRDNIVFTCPSAAATVDDNEEEERDSENEKEDPSPINATETSTSTKKPRKPSKEFQEKWKHIVTSSYFISRGRELEEALNKRKLQYMDSSLPSSYSSPLNPDGTKSIQHFLLQKTKSILYQFHDLENQWMILKDERKQKREDLERNAHNLEQESGCVRSSEDVQNMVREVLHEEHVKEIKNPNENDYKDEDKENLVNLWWLIQSPLFYQSMDSIDSLVDVLSGQNENLDRLIDFLMEATSSFSGGDGNIEENGLLGSHLKKVIQRKLSQINVEIPKEVEPYWKKTGMLKQEWKRSIEQIFQSIPDDAVSQAQDTGMEIKQWVFNMVDSLA